jgi:DNA polymerase-3 subunit epsilon
MNAIASWARGRIHGFDIESTGPDPGTDRIVTATFLTVDLGNVVEGRPKVSATSWLANPGVDISEGAEKVHGISNDYAREHGRPPSEVVTEIGTAIEQAWAAGEPVVIYNAPFDITMTHCELGRHCDDAGVHLLTSQGQGLGPIVDPLVLDKKINKFVRGKGGRKLINTCKRWGIVLDEDDAHTAEGDTLAACRLAWKMAHSPLIAGIELGALQAFQANWYRLQTLDYASWLDKQSRGEEAARVRQEADGWPLRLLSAPPPGPVESAPAEVPF